MTDRIRCPKRFANSNTCMCKPRCAICGFGPHMAVHLPAFKDGVKVREHYDHAYTPRKPR